MRRELALSDQLLNRFPFRSLPYQNEFDITAASGDMF
jgi:hypothetical protein